MVKYVTRWKNKNGIEDLKKARHYLDILIKLVEKPAKADALGKSISSYLDNTKWDPSPPVCVGCSEYED